MIVLLQLRTAIVVLMVLTVLTGGAYPLLVTVIAQTAFPRQANGSLIERGEQTVGSEIIGQSFSRPEYFWGRLSATSPMPYNGASSSASNFGPMNPGLTDAAKARIEELRTALPASIKIEGTADAKIPVDLVTASASGLDPHISLAAAEYQVPRVAASRKMSEDGVRAIVRANTAGRLFGLFGEPRVNVLRLNLALDEQHRP